jgi:AAHS family 4-hydroxybenzoate transporter-like MFS transporter
MFGLVMSAAPIGLVIGAWVAGPSEDRHVEHDFASESKTRTLLSEYAPQRKRSLMVTFVFTGFILRWTLIGFTAAWLIPAYGWRAVLVVGGTLSLALTRALLWLLPESARLLAIRRVSPARVAILCWVTGCRFVDRIRLPKASLNAIAKRAVLNGAAR